MVSSQTLGSREWMNEAACLESNTTVDEERKE